MIHALNATTHTLKTACDSFPHAAIIRYHPMRERLSPRSPTFFIFDEPWEAIGHWTGGYRG